MSNVLHTTGAVVGVDLVGFFVSDPARSIKFYHDVLGMVPTNVDDQGRGAEFTLADGSTFAVWDGSMFGKTSGGCPMLAVDDIESAVASCRERGAQLSDITDTPVCRMSFGEDPDGNTIIIHQRKPDAV